MMRMFSPSSTQKTYGSCSKNGYAVRARMSSYQRMLRVTSATRRTAATLPKRSLSATSQPVREKDRQTGRVHLLLRCREVVGHAMKGNGRGVGIHDRVCRAWVAVSRLANAARVRDE